MKKKPKSERKLVFYRACKTYGIKEGMSHCGDDECKQCNHISDILTEHIKGALNLDGDEK